MNTKEKFTAFTLDLQAEICSVMEKLDGKTPFMEDRWVRKGGGSGITKVMEHGNIFEKAGVNTSAVHGELPEIMKANFKVKDSRFFACGISLVIHPLNPMVPTAHANFRYFELYNDQSERTDQWFGGGSDLTPYYVFPEDCIHFHRCFKSACDRFSSDWYHEFKSHCDRYFINTHRGNEARGIGGIFYDYVRPDEIHTEEDLFNFSKTCGQAFMDAYFPIVEKRKDLPYSEKETFWQELRRGRYVEFNLIHDRGTLFGLKTNGRTESILMSLPPRARWDYNYIPEPNSKEAELLEYLKPRNWAEAAEVEYQQSFQKSTI